MIFEISILVCILLFYFSVSIDELNNKEINNFIMFVYVGILIVFLSSTREVFNDSARYLLALEYYKSLTFLEMLTDDITKDIGFRSYIWLVGQFDSYLLFPLTTLIFYLSYKALINEVSKNSEIQCFILILLITLPAFWQMTFSALRQSMSLSIIFASLVLLIRGRVNKAILICCISIIFHKSALIFLLCIILCSIRFINIKTILIGYISIVLLSFIGLNQILFEKAELSFLFSEQKDIYLSSSVDYYKTGFRIDFFLMSIFPLLFIPLRCYNSLTTSLEPMHQLLLKLYLMLNGVYFFMNFIPFSDRIAAYSWVLIPLLLGVIVEGKYSRFHRYHQLVVLFLPILSFVVYMTYNAHFVYG